MDRAAQVPLPFPVDYSHLANPLSPAGREICRHKVPDLVRQEVMEVQDPIDREYYRLFLHVLLPG